MNWLTQDDYRLACGACIALAGGCCDLRWRRIPNWLTGPALAAALLLAFVSGGARTLLDSSLAGLLAWAIFAAMFFMGGMGGGDVKLMTAVAAFVGVANLPLLLISTALVGGCFALIVALLRGQLVVLLRRITSGFFPLLLPPAASDSSRVFLPYGVPIAAGALITLWEGVNRS